MENSRKLTKIERKEKELEQVAVNYLTAMGLNLKEEHKLMFVQVAKTCGLNPFKKEIYAVPYKQKNPKTGEIREVMSVITGYEVYVKRAEESGLIDYWNFGSETRVDSNTKAPMLYGWCEIKRKDRSKPMRIEIPANEYSTGQSTWLQKPKLMIEKCAISRAFRLCFPLEVGSLPYTADEIWFKHKEEEIEKKQLEEVKETPTFVERSQGTKVEGWDINTEETNNESISK